MEQRLAPALDEALLVLEPGAHPAVRFRHDRIRETVLTGLPPPRRRSLQLAMARRLAAVPSCSRRGGAVPARGRRGRRRDGAATGWRTCCGAPPTKPR